jgi:hypothetical protein
VTPTSSPYGIAAPPSPYTQTPVPGDLGAVRNPYGPDRCEQCGSTPARPVMFGRVTGMILLFRLNKIAFTACRSCGLSVGRAQQSKTLMTGWWGIISFFCNIWYVLRNAVSLVRVSKLDQPSGGVSQPLDPGRSAFLRLGSLIAVAFFGAWILIANAADGPASWSEGNCVKLTFDTNGREIAEPKHCSNDGTDMRIVDVVQSEDQCPVQSDGYVTVDETNDIYCIDEPS